LVDFIATLDKLCNRKTYWWAVDCVVACNRKLVAFGIKNVALDSKNVTWDKLYCNRKTSWKAIDSVVSHNRKIVIFHRKNDTF